MFLTVLLFDSIPLQLGKKQEMEANEVIRMEKEILRYNITDISFILCESKKTVDIFLAAPVLVM